MIKCKIFNGAFGLDSLNADEKFNQWITEHPNIDVLEFKYCLSRYGAHSICILYKEKKDND